MGQSQTITIKDHNTGEPLEVVSILSNSPRAFANTNTQGQADVTAFKGADKIEIRSLGYKTEIISYLDLENLNFEVSLNSSLTQFDEVVVSATRWSQPSVNIPSKISIISPKDVALSNPQTAADLLGSSGEVFIQKASKVVVVR